MQTPIAHTKNDAGIQQDLVEHLENVANLARAFAANFDAGDLAYLAGILHDIGKFDPTFQQYLQGAEGGTLPKGKHGPDHKGAGAVLASKLGFDALSFLIKGHHGGLPAQQELRSWLPERAGNAAVQAAITAAQAAIARIATKPVVTLPEVLRKPTKSQLEFFVRMLFSALVDADFLDTEAHFQAAKHAERGSEVEFAALWERFAANQRQLSGQHSSPVNRLRHEVYTACLAAAEWDPGFFRLTVPTGGGKTRSSLGFALRHSALQGKRRVIYAIPYTSITEQTADEFRGIFPEAGIVLEHHSAYHPQSDDDIPLGNVLWSRLAAENWDAPLIVTTTVQLFESLLAAGTSRCRKLHRIANSVIILDETQTLPPHVLTTILDVLRELVAHYGVTVVLCTATQPALDKRNAFNGLAGIREIIPDPRPLFAALKRVDYRWPERDERWSWERVAGTMRSARQALAIVNTRHDAMALFTALDDASALHLSTWMCGAHRRVTLAEVRRRLCADEACRLVSTQVIEAGVDVDFALGLRALAPLDSIVQAAGRVNREGRREMGELIVFAPEEGKLPQGAYHIGTQETRGMLPVDPHDPAVFQRYFAAYYDHLTLDQPKVEEARETLDYPAVADRFRMITENSAPIVVPYGDAQRLHLLLEQLERQPDKARSLLRRLQPFTVNLPLHTLRKADKAGLAQEIFPGLWQWFGRYDEKTGIDLDSSFDPLLAIWS